MPWSVGWCPQTATQEPPSNQSSLPPRAPFLYSPRFFLAMQSSVALPSYRTSAGARRPLAAQLRRRSPSPTTSSASVSGMTSSTSAPKATTASRLVGLMLLLTTLRIGGGGPRSGLTAVEQMLPTNVDQSPSTVKQPSGGQHDPDHHGSSRHYGSSTDGAKVTPQEVLDTFAAHARFENTRSAGGTDDGFDDTLLEDPVNAKQPRARRGGRSRHTKQASTESNSASSTGPRSAAEDDEDEEDANLVRRRRRSASRGANPRASAASSAESSPATSSFAMTATALGSITPVDSAIASSATSAVAESPTHAAVPRFTSRPGCASAAFHEAPSNVTAPWSPSSASSSSGTPSRANVPWRCGVCMSGDINHGSQGVCSQCHAGFDRAGIRVFVGQVRKDNTAAYIRWLLRTVTPDMVIHHIEAHTTKGEQRGRGAAFVHLDSNEDGERLCRLVNKRVFSDVDASGTEGVWMVGPSDADVAALASFARDRAVFSGRPTALPRQPVVVEARGHKSADAVPYDGSAPVGAMGHRHANHHLGGIRQPYRNGSSGAPTTTLSSREIQSGGAAAASRGPQPQPFQQSSYGGDYAMAAAAAAHHRALAMAYYSPAPAAAWTPTAFYGHPQTYNGFASAAHQRGGFNNVAASVNAPRVSRSGPSAKCGGLPTTTTTAAGDIMSTAPAAALSPNASRVRQYQHDPYGFEAALRSPGRQSIPAANASASPSSSISSRQSTPLPM